MTIVVLNNFIFTRFIKIELFKQVLNEVDKMILLREFLIIIIIGIMYVQGDLLIFVDNNFRCFLL